MWQIQAKEHVAMWLCEWLITHLGVVQKLKDHVRRLFIIKHSTVINVIICPACVIGISLSAGGVYSCVPGGGDGGGVRESQTNRHDKKKMRTELDKNPVAVGKKISHIFFSFLFFRNHEACNTKYETNANFFAKYSYVMCLDILFSNAVISVGRNWSKYGPQT